VPFALPPVELWMARATKDNFPDFIEPQLATLASHTPTGPQWVHEVKFDGYRAQVRVQKRYAIINTRRGYDWSDRFRDIAKVAGTLPDCIIDGEAVVLDQEGRTDFGALQSALASGRTKPIVLFAFDLLFLKGKDLRRQPLLERKQLLLELFDKHRSGFENRIRYSQHFSVAGQEMHASACAMGLEGVVSKRTAAAYRSGRNESWIKSKCGERETLIIGGWRETAGGIQSLAMGQMREQSFEYVGKAKTGFQDQQQALRPRLLAVEQQSIPFTKGRPERKDGQRWCKPVLEAEISFTAWTQSRHVRHAKFLGLREDLAEKPSGSSVKSTSGKNKGRHIQRLLEGAEIPSDEELKAYWRKLGPKALKYLARRPLTLVRHDNGQVFFHTGGFPAIPTAIQRLSIAKREGGEGIRLCVDSVAGLVALADIGIIEVHPWNATVDDLEHPDQMVLDLDPGAGIEWGFVRDTALDLNEWLKKEHGLKSWPKATGGKGLHLVVPLDRSRTHDEARDWSHTLMGKYARKDSRYTVTASLAARPGHLFLDYLRNGRGTTAVGTYSPRARPGVPVAVPLTWQQVERGIRSDAVSMGDLVGGNRRGAL
jgi:bifunctional non-homologous end joining protein LigD